jgi:GT2 family glycosyltransferase
VWNKFRLTSNFLSDLSLIITPGDEIIVVNNGSTDQTADLLAWWENQLGSQLVVLHNRDNRGFGPGCNQGALLARHEHLIFINNDVVIQGDFITPMVSFSEKEDPHSIVFGRLVNWDSGWNQFNGTIIPYGEAWLFGLLRSLWIRLEGFDEQFVPCDFEDVDLSHRASQEGVILKEMALPVVHMGGQTGANLYNRIAITGKNQRRFMAKWGLEP